MLIIILSPTLALASDYIRQKLFIAKKWVFLVIFLMTIPSLLIWLTGYNYSEVQFLWYAIMFIIAGVLLTFYTLVDNRIGLKAAISVIATLPIIGITFLAAMGTSYGGEGREIITKFEFRNYIALQLEPQLYEDGKTLRIKKRSYSELLRKRFLKHGILTRYP